MAAAICPASGSKCSIRLLNAPDDYDADAGIVEILLELDSLIGGHQGVESFALGKTDEFAVGHAIPPLRLDGDDLMICEMTR